VVSASLSGAEADITVVGPDDVVAAMGAERTAGVGRWDGGGKAPLELAGRLTGRAVEEAIRLWKGGHVDAVVTGPADKLALNTAGYRFPGHTELLRDLTGAKQVAMMLASDRLRVVLVTTHLALREAIAIVTRERIVEIGRITQRYLAEWFGVGRPRLALCALNPHGGEGGMFGHEEERTLRPAAEELGIAGPLPADTVFVRAMRGEFDAVLAPYHDVGMTAIKVASFGRAVNVTLGLPVPRTSPDHGTAMDIAGRGVADPSSMQLAIKVAGEIVRRVRGDVVA
jgi:4-hydroxythreonine-4-phosphate dehydrogenase